MITEDQDVFQMRNGLLNAKSKNKNKKLDKNLHVNKTGTRLRILSMLDRKLGSGSVIP
jgi:hypothetical protein